jgi:hypothetical protein
MMVMIVSLVAIRDSHLILAGRCTTTPHAQCECNIVEQQRPTSAMFVRATCVAIAVGVGDRKD